MNNSVYSTIEQLRLSTQSRLDQLQIECAPFLADKFVRLEENKYSYIYQGLETRITLNDKFRAFKVNGLRFIYKSTKKKYSRRDWLKNMVDDKIVYPFILFNNNKAIPWSRIELIRDYDYTYILIHGIRKDIDLNLSIIEFPCLVRYGEDDDLLPANERSLALCFDGTGMLTFGDHIAMRLEIIDKDIYADVKTITERHPDFEIDAKWGHVATTMSIVTFKNGLLYPEGTDELTCKGWNIYANTKTLDFNCYKYIVFYSTKTNKESSNMFHPAIDYKSNRATILDNTRNVPRYLDDLFKLSRFDFSYDRDKDFKQNISDALDYIMSYNANLMDDAYHKDTDVYCDSYTGKQLIDRAKANGGYMSVSRKRNGRFDNYMIMYVNGERYIHSDIIRYDNNMIDIPVKDINPSDKIEFIFFSNACNISNSIIIYKDTPVYVYPGYDMRYVSLFSNTKHNLDYNVFDIDEDGRTQFELKFTYRKSELENHYYIDFEDEFYYGLPLTITSNKQMRHKTFTFEDTMKDENDTYYFLLPTDFNYCHNKGHYMVFLNGRTLSKQNFTITEVTITRPFDKLYLYITYELTENDVLDVYYLPCATMDAIWIDDLKVSGDIVVDAKSIDVPLSTDNYFIFVDGKKVYPSDVINISRNKVRITTGYGSLHNVLFMRYNPTIPELQEAYRKTDSDDWSRYIDSLEQYNLNKLIGNITDLSGTDKDNMMSKMYPLSTIVSDIVFDFYVRRAGVTKKNDVFVYDFEVDAVNGNAGEGNVVALTATDSRKYDKLHVYDNNYKDEEIDGVPFAKSPIDQDKQ